MKSAKEILGIIKQKGYWTVNVRPQQYNESLIPLSSRLFTEFLQPCRISIRGWDYPVGIFPKEEYGNTIDGIQLCNEGYFPEVWKFTKTGNFYQVFGFREDHLNWYTEKYEKQILSVQGTLFSLTEIFLFAKKLFSCEEMAGQEPHIEIELKLLKGRELIVDDPNKMPFLHPRICKMEDSFMYKPNVTREELLLKYDEYALEAFFDLVRLFDWDNPPVDGIKQDQKKFLFGRG